MVRGNHSIAIAPALHMLAEAFGATQIVGEDDWVEFPVSDLYVIANVVAPSSRLRIRVYLHADSERLVRSWVEDAPAPHSGLIEAACHEDLDWRPRLVFERPLVGHLWADDPLFLDVNHYSAAWLQDSSAAGVSARDPFVVVDDPREKPPASAWLLKGSEASFPRTVDLERAREEAGVGIFAWDWTAAPQTEVGDLAIFYFVSPRKTAHFVARAASRAFFSREIAVVADQAVSQSQWWANFTTPIEIEPIPVDVLRQAAGGYLPLRGRSGLYLSPNTIAALPIRAVRQEDEEELHRVVRTPIGLADLPAPGRVGRSVWKSIAPGALRFEAYVTSHIVEPLLADLLEGTGLTWRREHPVGRRWADIVILKAGVPIHVIEVKKVIRTAPTGDWLSSPDFRQVRWYADRLGVPATLIDSHRVVLIDQGREQPSREVIRRTATDTDLAAIKAHFLKC